MRRLLPYLIIGVLCVAPFFSAALTAVSAAPPLQGTDEVPITPQTDPQAFAENIRYDLELLADEFWGTNVRPDEWSGNVNSESPAFLGEIWLDMSKLADEVFGEENARPLDWAGVATTTPERIARNLRHDLELMANYVFEDDERPEDWRSAAPLNLCSIPAQSLIEVMRTTFEFEPNTPGGVLNYCGAVVGEAQDRLAAEGLTLVSGDIPVLLANVRGDFRRLTDELYGLGEAPEGVTGTVTIDTAVMANDIFTDIELVSDDRLGLDNRPPGWVFELGSSPGVWARSLRGNLELMADIALEGREDHLIDGRPEGWSGAEGFGDNLTSCAPEIQALVLLMQQYYRYETPDVAATNPVVFCRTLASDLNVFVESDPERITEEELEGVVGRSGRPVAESDLAFAYLDVGALQFMGTMPRGVEFEAWYRNFSESTMMYVVGEDFALYISQEWSTLPEERYYRLPTLQGVIPETYCFAYWCSGPGPTPTPTGQAPTPTPGAAPGMPPLGDGNLALVPWNQVRVYYDQDNVGNGTVLVRMELCGVAVGVGCEPVQAVYDAGGNPLPVLNVIGPYPVFELPYGYNNAYVLVSQSYFANEIWISDPTLRGVSGPPATPVGG